MNVTRTTLQGILKYPGKDGHLALCPDDARASQYHERLFSPRQSSLL